MNNEFIYVICSGEYSCRKFRGYFTNKEDAERWCEFYNKTRDDDKDEYYIEKLKKMKITTKEKNPVYKKYYDITFNIFNDNYTVKERFLDESEDMQNEINAGLFGKINFIILNDDKDRALKIALDKKSKILYIYFNILQGNKYSYEDEYNILEQDIEKLKTSVKLLEKL